MVELARLLFCIGVLQYCYASSTKDIGEQEYYCKDAKKYNPHIFFITKSQNIIQSCFESPIVPAETLLQQRNFVNQVDFVRLRMTEVQSKSTIKKYKNFLEICISSCWKSAKSRPRREKALIGSDCQFLPIYLSCFGSNTRKLLLF